MRKEFERDQTPKFYVLRLVNDAHAAAAYSLDHAVVGDNLAEERLGVRHGYAILGMLWELSQRTSAALVSGSAALCLTNLFSRSQWFDSAPHRFGPHDLRPAVWRVAKVT
jgi:hypothetical protein